MNELTDLFLDELADVYDAEKQLVKALPKMASAAASADLKKAFQSHLAETKRQVERVKEVFAACDKPAKGKHCKAMEGLLKEGAEILKEWKGSAAADAALISAAQKVEHYEIATYGCLCTWAELLGNGEALALLKENIEEEETADKKLTEIAQSGANSRAQAEPNRARGNGHTKRRTSSPALVNLSPAETREGAGSQTLSQQAYDKSNTPSALFL